MEAAGLPLDPDLVADAESEPIGGHEAASRLLEIAEPPTAIFCYNDRMAMGVYRALNDRRLRIPEDISVMGFDDQQPIASGLFPGLTTVALPHYEMGAWAVECLAAQIAGTPIDGDSHPLRLPCPLVTRSSVAPV
jgi:LacI family transcriptional regulator